MTEEEVNKYIMEMVCMITDDFEALDRKLLTMIRSEFSDISSKAEVIDIVYSNLVSLAIVLMMSKLQYDPDFKNAMREEVLLCHQNACDFMDKIQMIKERVERNEDG